MKRQYDTGLRRRMKKGASEAIKLINAIGYQCEIASELITKMVNLFQEQRFENTVYLTRNFYLIKMDTDLLKLLLPLGLIAGGIYLKSAKDKEPNASKNLWKILIIVGTIGFILKLVIYLNK